jgi:hypothetical protein
MRVRISCHPIDIEVEEHLGYYSPDIASELLQHAFLAYCWAVEEQRQHEQALRDNDAVG